MRSTLAVVSLLLAGCLAGGPDGASSDQEDGMHRLTVEVQDPAGAPVAGAVVEGHVAGETVTARSDSAGQAVLDLPEGNASISAAGTTWTRECADAPAAQDTLVLTVYPLRTNDSFEGTLVDPPFHAGLAGPVWDPTPLPLPGDGAAWAARFAAIDVTLSWENSPEGSGDLGIAVGDTSFRYWNQEYQASFGPFTEQREIERDELEGVLDAADAIRTGPSVSTGHAAATGIPYTVTWDLRLSADGIQDCPGAA